MELVHHAHQDTHGFNRADAVPVLSGLRHKQVRLASWQACSCRTSVVESRCRKFKPSALQAQDALSFYSIFSRNCVCVTKTEHNCRISHQPIRTTTTLVQLGRYARPQSAPAQAPHHKRWHNAVPIAASKAALQHHLACGAVSLHPRAADSRQLTQQCNMPQQDCVWRPVTAAPTAPVKELWAAPLQQPPRFCAACRGALVGSATHGSCRSCPLSCCTQLSKACGDCQIS